MLKKLFKIQISKERREKEEENTSRAELSTKQSTAQKQTDYQTKQSTKQNTIQGKNNRAQRTKTRM